MHDGKVFSAAARDQRRNSTARLREILTRRVWLPAIVYEALPYLYILCGVVALVSAIFARDWTWILPWAILVGLICLHAGLALAALRYRLRRRPPVAEPD
jgi:hypothetical protein